MLSSRLFLECFWRFLPVLTSSDLISFFCHEYLFSLCSSRGIYCSRVFVVFTLVENCLSENYCFCSTLKCSKTVNRRLYYLVKFYIAIIVTDVADIVSEVKRLTSMPGLRFLINKDMVTLCVCVFCKSVKTCQVSVFVFAIFHVISLHPLWHSSTQQYIKWRWSFYCISAIHSMQTVFIITKRICSFVIGRLHFMSIICCHLISTFIFSANCMPLKHDDFVVFPLAHKE